jgi:serine/threonine protein kinase
MAIEAALGVAHLHSEQVIHRDLAARNLLIDAHWHVRWACLRVGLRIAYDSARVADFGFARVKAHCASKGYTHTDMGPIRWSAPEVQIDRTYTHIHAMEYARMAMYANRRNSFHYVGQAMRRKCYSEASDVFSFGVVS